jgi:hypothetical protein
LKHCGVDPVDVDSNTDLREACGDFIFPCISSVGDCLMAHSAVVDGREEVDSEACQCYVQGSTMALEVPDRPEVNVQCSFVCLSAIKGMFEHHLFKVNGDLATSLACPRTFENLARELYSNEFYDVQPSEEDTDGLQVESVVDEHVVSAATAAQMHINIIRGHECNILPQLTEPQVTYARRGEVEDGMGQYLLEFKAANGQEFSVRVVHLPKYKQLFDPATQSADPENLQGRFQVLSVRPDPCATGAAAELVQTMAHVQAINKQNLAWKAAYSPELAHKTLDQFGVCALRCP